MHKQSVTRVAAVVLLVAVGALSASARGQPAGNAAIEWNAIATTAAAGQPPHVAPLSLAMVQVPFTTRSTRSTAATSLYLVSPPANASDSKEAAVATAAFRVLVGFPDLPGLFPAQISTLQPLYDASLAGVPDGAAKTGGIAVGEAAARAMLVERTGDGRGGPFTVVEGTDPGEWRLAPPQGPTGIVARDPAPWVGNVRPFLVPNVDAPDGRPNALASAHTRRTSTRSRSSARSRARGGPRTRPRPRSSGRTAAL